MGVYRTHHGDFGDSLDLFTELSLGFLLGDPRNSHGDDLDDVGLPRLGNRHFQKIVNGSRQETRHCQLHGWMWKHSKMMSLEKCWVMINWNLHIQNCCYDPNFYLKWGSFYYHCFIWNGDPIKVLLQGSW